MAYPYLCSLILAVSPIKPTSDLWWGMRLAGYPSGSFHERVEPLADGGFSTIENMYLIDADPLCLSEATARTHVAHFLSELDVTDRLAALMAAVRRGILRL